MNNNRLLTGTDDPQLHSHSPAPQDGIACTRMAAPVRQASGAASGARRAYPSPRLILTGIGLMLIAFNLRSPITSIGPLLPEIIRSAHLSAAAASLLTTLPAFCFGLSGMAAPALERRWGAGRAVLGVLVLLVLGTLLRGRGAVPALFAGQILACMAIGIINVLLPAIVKQIFPRRLALITGLYTMAISVGSAVAAGTTVPLEKWFGVAWPGALAGWSIPMVIAAMAWALQSSPAASGRARQRLRGRGLLGDPVAWQVTVFMGMQSSLAYITFGWLPTILRDRGLDAGMAGLVLSVAILVSAFSSLCAPLLVIRGRDQRRANVLCTAICGLGLAGCLYGPLGMIWIWSVFLGVGLGTLFTLALTIIGLRAPDGEIAAQLSGMAQSGGYLLAALGPFLTGILHHWTGNWHLVALWLLINVLLTVISGIGAGRDRLAGSAAGKGESKPGLYS